MVGDTAEVERCVKEGVPVHDTDFQVRNVVVHTSER